MTNTLLVVQCVGIALKRSDHFIYLLSLLLSRSTRRKFTLNDLLDKQAVVTGVVPSPPLYVPSILSRIGFSVPTARRFSSNVANSRSRAVR